MLMPESGTGDGAAVSYIEGELVSAEAVLRGEGTLSAPRLPLREEIAGNWLLAYKSPNTRKAYARDIRTWFTYCDDWGVDVLRARTRDANGYLEWLQSGEAGELTDASMGRKLAAVSSFYKYAMAEHEDDVLRNPVANVRDRPKGDAFSTSAWLKRDEVTRLLATADRSPWEAALARVMIYTGVRVSELAEARASDFDPAEGSLIVRRKGGDRAIIAVPSDAVQAVLRYLDGRRSGPLFTDPRTGRPLTRDAVAYRIDVLVAAAGISKKITPHCLRHTAATLAREAGRDVHDIKDMLGHSNVETTMRYLHKLQTLADSATHDVARYVRGEA